MIQLVRRCARYGSLFFSRCRNGGVDQAGDLTCHHVVAGCVEVEVARQVEVVAGGLCAERRRRITACQGFFHAGAGHVPVRAVEVEVGDVEVPAFTQRVPILRLDLVSQREVDHHELGARSTGCIAHGAQQLECGLVHLGEWRRLVTREEAEAVRGLEQALAAVGCFGQGCEAPEQFPGAWGVGRRCKETAQMRDRSQRSQISQQPR
jgi:hypothetical protein